MISTRYAYLIWRNTNEILKELKEVKKRLKEVNQK